MVEQRANLDYGADDTTLADEAVTPDTEVDETVAVEGDGFTMTETPDATPVTPIDDEDEDEVNEEADTLGAP